MITAVTFARHHHLVVAVRGGGHGVPGFAVCDGGLMLDLSQMKSVRVDPVARTARAEGGCTWGDVDHETQAFGLATTGGIARPTGIAGLTLGGGHGYLIRTYGLAGDNLLSVDVVTADGQVCTASATVPAPHTHVVVEHLGGAVSRVGEEATAVAHREALYNFLLVGMWTDAAADTQVIGWVRELWRALQPFSSGGLYVNYEAEHDQGRVQAAYSPAKYARLAAVKARYDPTNLFRLNQNILPVG